MRTLIFNLTSWDRLIFAGAICFSGWTVALVGTHIRSEGLVDAGDNVLGRDFLAFYAAGRLAALPGEVPLYDGDTQSEMQQEVLAPERQRQFYYYINPASVAMVYGLLARLQYLPAYYVHTLMMLAFFVIGTLLLRPHLAILKRGWLPAMLIGATWWPMTHAITAGQNTALSFMLLALAYVATVRGRQGTAGLALGVLFFKPQHAIPLLGLLLLRRQWVTVGVSLVCAAGHYVLGAWCCGWDWPAQMLEASFGYFRQQGRSAHGPTLIALMQVVDYSVIQPLEHAGAGQGLILAAKWLSRAIVAAIVLLLICVWRRADPRRPDFRVYWALAVTGTLLISAHAHYYDAALVVLPLLLILDYLHETNSTAGASARVVLILIYLLFPFVFMFSVAQRIHFQPVFLVVVWIAIWSAMIIRSSRSRGTSAPVVRASGSTGTSRKDTDRVRHL